MDDSALVQQQLDAGDYFQGWPLCNLSMSSSVGSNASASIMPPDRSFNYHLFDFTISLVLLVLVALPGLAGNFISVYILSRPQMRTSLNIILIGIPPVSCFPSFCN